MFLLWWQAWLRNVRGGGGTEERRMNGEMERLEWFVVRSVVDVDLMRLCELERQLDDFRTGHV
jgi:hypothetical protein